jgi:hypothetical protein
MSWVTQQVMARNAEALRSFAGRPLIYQGRSMSIEAWATELAVQPMTMAMRVMKLRRGEITADKVFAVNRTLPAHIKAAKGY